MAATQALPRGRGAPITTVSFDGRDRPDGPLPRTTWLAVSPGYLDSMGILLLSGRALEERDRADALPVAVVDEDFIARFFDAERQAIGSRISMEGQSREIVGIVRSVRQRRIEVLDGPASEVYLPFAQAPHRAPSFVVRASGGELDRLAEPVRRAVWSIDRDLPIARLMSLDDYIAIQLSGFGVFSAIVGAFAAFALVLAALGVYGVLAYSVAQRTREIGIRMAMGARRRQIVGMVLIRGARLTLVGLLIGAPMVWGTHRLVGAALGELVRGSAVTLPLIALALAVTAALASYLPARRASGVAPTTALRQE